jgi:prepilin-type N-terminal cleavage/methylation domain-containing protein
MTVNDDMGVGITNREGKMTRKMSRTRSKQCGFTLIELLIVITVICILAAMAMPNMLAARKAAHETDAIAVMREIATAQELFRTRRLGGSFRFGTVAELGDTPVGHYELVHWPDPANPGVRREYVFVDVEPPTTTSWIIKGSPVTPGHSGDRYFAVMEDGVTRVSTTDPTDRAAVAAMGSTL